MLILDPQGRLLDIHAGYLPAKDLERVLSEGLALNARLAKLPVSKRKAELRKHHTEARQAADELEDEGPLAGFSRQRIADDHRFVEKHPLLAASAFRPQALLGNGRSFFGSTSNGSPGGFIGDVDERQRRASGGSKEMEDLLERFRKKKN